MYRFFIAIALACASGISLSAAETQPEDLASHPEVSGALAVVDAWIDGVRDYERVPGISAALVVDQDVIFAKGYGFANERRKVPATPDTIYSICSISKLFTSIGVMQMRDAGKLSLRDPVRDHLDWFDIERRHSAAGPARIHGLLTHSSGLPREVDFPYWVQEDFPFPDRATMIERIGQQATLYPADTLFQYSNLGLTLAGEIVEKAAGRPFAQYVREAILDPLQMSDTRTFFPKDLHGRQMAIGYSGLGRDLKRTPVPEFDTAAVTPAAGFTSTANDLAKFARWQFRLLGEKGSQEVLDANTLREMHRVHWVDRDWKVSWGLGFVVSNADGTTVVGHGGGCPGYITSLLIVPQFKVAAIALTNAGDGPASAIANNMLKTMAPALKAARKPAQLTMPDVDLKDYVGNYGGTIWGGETAIRVWGDKLVVISLPSDDLENVLKLQHVSSDEFVLLNDDGEKRDTVVFTRDSDGRVSGLKRHSQVYRKLDT